MSYIIIMCNVTTSIFTLHVPRVQRLCRAICSHQEKDLRHQFISTSKSNLQNYFRCMCNHGHTYSFVVQNWSRFDIVLR